MPRFSVDNIEANANLMEQFKVFADKKGCTTSQLAIGFKGDSESEVSKIFSFVDTK